MEGAINQVWKQRGSIQPGIETEGFYLTRFQKRGVPLNQVLKQRGSIRPGIARLPGCNTSGCIQPGIETE